MRNSGLVAVGFGLGILSRWIMELAPDRFAYRPVVLVDGLVGLVDLLELDDDRTESNATHSSNQ